MAVAMGIGRFVYTPILPGMMDELGMSASGAGFIASANYVGYLAGAVLASGGWGHGRERLVMIAALLASGLLAVSMGLTISVPAFVVIRFLAGIASAFVMVFASTIVFGHLAAAGRTDLQAFHFGGVGLGISVSSVMTGALVLAAAPWWESWLWAGALSVLGFLVVATMIDRGPLRAGDGGREPLLPRTGAFVRIIIAYGLFGFGYVVTATFLIAIVRQGEAGRLYESAVWLATGVAGIPSVLVWSKVAKRLGLTVTFAIGCIVEAVGVLASVALGGYAGPMLGGILLGATFIAVTALGLQAAARLVPQSPRRALAMMTASFGIGQIVGPIFAGYTADITGTFFVPSLGAAAMLALSAVIAWDAGRRSREMLPQ